MHPEVRRPAERFTDSENANHVWRLIKLNAKNLIAAALCFGLASICGAQNAPATQDAGPAKAGRGSAADSSRPQQRSPLLLSRVRCRDFLRPSSMPDLSARLAVNGILSGTGMWQSNHVPGDNPTQAALSNGQIFIQKTDGWFQFYLQAGAYTFRLWQRRFLPPTRH